VLFRSGHIDCLAISNKRRGHARPAKKQRAGAMAGPC
jgi:hypothetical protein